MAELIRNLVVNVLSLKCYEKYFIESDFFDGKREQWKKNQIK